MKRPQKTKRGRPVTTGKGELIGVRLLQPIVQALDSYIAGSNNSEQSRPAAIRKIVVNFLRQQKLFD
jgi:hypothetical protein